MWSPSEAVDKLSALIEAYPQIVDIHFWAQLPGEPVSTGDRRIECLAEKVLPQLSQL